MLSETASPLHYEPLSPVTVSGTGCPRSETLLFIFAFSFLFFSFPPGVDYLRAQTDEIRNGWRRLGVWPALFLGGKFWRLCVR